MRQLGAVLVVVVLAAAGFWATRAHGEGGLTAQPGGGGMALRTTPGLPRYSLGDLTSQTLTVKAWKALEARDHAAVAYYAKWCVNLYAEEAKSQQASLKAFAPTERVHEYAALNDVGTSLFILGESLRVQKRPSEAAVAFRRVIREFGFAQCWDPRGWFWNVADAAAIRMGVLGQEGGTHGRDGPTSTGS